MYTIFSMPTKIQLLKNAFLLIVSCCSRRENLTSLVHSVQQTHD